MTAAACPFCGNSNPTGIILQRGWKGDRYARIPSNLFWVECLVCDACGPAQPTEQRARIAWTFRGGKAVDSADRPTRQGPDEVIPAPVP